MPHCYAYPMAAVAADVAAFVVSPRDLAIEVLLVERAQPPARGRWALPGGFVDVGAGYVPGADQGESLEAAARRELQEETGLDLAALDAPLWPAAVAGAPGRDPRGRVVSIVHGVVLPVVARERVRPGDDAARVRFAPVASPGELAFDHGEVLVRAAAALAQRVVLDASAMGPWIEAGLREHLALVYEQLRAFLPQAPAFDRWLARQVEDGRLQPTAVGFVLPPTSPAVSTTR